MQHTPGSPSRHIRVIVCLSFVDVRISSHSSISAVKTFSASQRVERLPHQKICFRGTWAVINILIPKTLLAKTSVELAVIYDGRHTLDLQVDRKKDSVRNLPGNPVVQVCWQT